MVPSRPIQAHVGVNERFECRMVTVNGIEADLVTISWTGPGGNRLTNDSRVIIRPTTVIRSKYYTSVVLIAYLTEDDKGLFSCNVMILDDTASAHIEISSLNSMYSYVV